LQVGVELLVKQQQIQMVMVLVKFTATADNAISYKFVFPDGTSSNAPSGVLEKLLQK
jgi:hypothetical protein